MRAGKLSWRVMGLVAAAVAAAYGVRLLVHRGRPNAAAETCARASSFGSVVHSLRDAKSGGYETVLPTTVETAACLAVAARDIGRCSELSPITTRLFGRSPEDICQRIYRILDPYPALARNDLEALRTSMRSDVTGSVELFGENIDEAGRIVARDFQAGGGPTVCRELEPLVSRSASEHLAKAFREVCPIVMTADCARVPDHEHVLMLQCRSLANVAKAAREGGKSEACGGEPTCIALFTGRVSACAPLEADLAQSWCDASSRGVE